tara:strand:- start:492 stop:707 length:216 start_codon:yes stop_codon:yes gene_type:complete
MEPIKPTNKKVQVMLSEKHAKILADIMRTSVIEIYAGDDWQERSTLEERTDRITVEVDVMTAIERFKKRIS